MKKYLRISVKLLIIMLITFLLSLIYLYFVNSISGTENILSSSARTFQICVLFLIALFLILYSVLSNLVTSPLKKIIKFAREIIKGNFKERVYISSQDEIGQLAEILNEMADNLIKMNENLEKTVKERTKELADKNKSLKRAKNVLEYEKDKVEAILYGISDGVFVIDKNLKVIIFNEAAEKISGFKENEVLGKRYSEILKFFVEKNNKNIEDLFIENIIQTKKSKELYKNLLLKKSGITINVANNASVIEDKNSRIIGCIVIFRDITKEEQIDKAKTEFVSLASHQLRTPLSSINWYSEMLLSNDAGKLNKKQNKFIQEVYCESQKMMNLVNTLLNISRMELGTFIIERTPTDLKKLSGETIKELKPLIIHKKSKITTHYEKNLGIVNIDPKLTKMIIQNLLSNAIKYTDQNGSIKLNIKKDEKNILISVADNGLGIPKDQQDKIFTKLFRTKEAIKKDTEGTGLGLYIIKSIIEKCCGKIYFESEQNKGTTFYVSIPLSCTKKK